MKDQDLTKVSSNGVPIGHRSGFAEVLVKYHTETNPVTKWAYREILTKRLLRAVEEIPAGDFTSFCKELENL